MNSFEEIFRQIRAASNAGFHHLALTQTLTLPSICGAMQSDNGLDAGSKYAAWFDEWVGHKYVVGTDRAPSITGQVCYSMRNGMSHQGRAINEQPQYTEVRFILPGQSMQAHNMIHKISSDQYFLYLNLERFCEDIIEGVCNWLSCVKDNENFKKHYPKMLQLRNGGIGASGVLFYS